MITTIIVTLILIILTEPILLRCLFTIFREEAQYKVNNQEQGGRT